MGQDGSLGMFLVAGCCLAEFFIAIFLAMSRRNWVGSFSSQSARAAKVGEENIE